MRLMFIAIFCFFLTACRVPVTYGYDPQGNRPYWENQPTQIITWSPGDGEHLVSPAAPIRFTFSKEVAGVTKKNIRVHRMNGYYYYSPYILQAEKDGRTYTILSREPREWGTHYSVEVSGVIDKEGNVVPKKIIIFQTEHRPAYQHGGYW